MSSAQVLPNPSAGVELGLEEVVVWTLPKVNVEGREVAKKDNVSSVSRRGAYRR
jgi:hypothetical protein